MFKKGQAIDIHYRERLGRIRYFLSGNGDLMCDKRCGQGSCDGCEYISLTQEEAEALNNNPQTGFTRSAY